MTVHRTTRALAVLGTALAAALLLSAAGSSAPARIQAVGTGLGHDGLIIFSDHPLDGRVHQLYVEHADGSHVHQLLHSTADDVQPMISPDGRRVVFTRQREHGALPDQMFVVGINGKGLHQVVPQGCPVATCGDAPEGRAWSPDGRRLVFTRAVFPDGPDAPPTIVELWICNVDGSHARALTHEHGLAQDDEAAWSPDGRHIVYLHWVYGSPDTFRIATIATDGTDMRLLTPAGFDSSNPSYSPQGDVISFQSPPDPGGANQILYTIRPDGTGLHELPASEGVATFHSSWSPDGTRLLFSHIPVGQLHGADLAVINRDGSGMHVLAQTPLNENDAFWGPAPARG